MRAPREKQNPQIDKVRARLERSAKLRERLAAKYERLDFLEMRLSSPSSPRWDAIPGGGSPNRDKLGDDIAKKIDTEQQIEKLKAKIREDGRQLSEYFEQLDPKQELLFCLRYVDGLSWPETIAGMYDSADDFEYELERYTNKAFKIHGAGLRALVDIMDLEAEGKDDTKEEEDEAGGDAE